MKTALLFFLIGAAAGAIGTGLYVQRYSATAPTLSTQATTVATHAVDQTKHATSQARDAMAAKLEEWHLSGDDIKADLAKTGQVVRQKAAAVGGAISDARILSVIKAKFVLDHDLSARAIDIDVHDAAVVLNGTVSSPDLIGKAIALSLDTDGVRTVTSRLRVATD